MKTYCQKCAKETVVHINWLAAKPSLNDLEPYIMIVPITCADCAFKDIIILNVEDWKLLRGLK